MMPAPAAGKGTGPPAGSPQTRRMPDENPPPPLPPADAFRAGALACLPLLMGAVPFGIVCGASAASVGMDFHQAFAMSWMVFAGSSQIAFVQLLGAGAPGWVIVLTGWIVNLRFMMYSAAMAPHFRAVPRLQRWTASYLLTDQGFAFGLLRLNAGRPAGEAFWFYMGLSVVMWAAWQAANLAGILLGRLIPASWSMDYVVALTFISLLAPLLKDRGMVLAAVIGAAVSVGLDVPMKLNLVAAALAGMAAALAMERLWPRRPSGQ